MNLADFCGGSTAWLQTFLRTLAKKRSPPSTWSCASVVVIARHCQISKLGVGLGLGMLFLQVPCGIFDDPKLVADVKEAVATIKKASIR